MANLLLFSYAILPKKLYQPKNFKYNSNLNPSFSLTALSALETYAGYLLHLKYRFNRIVMLGCHTFGSNNPADSELMSSYIQKLGISTKIIICTEGINTSYQVEQARSVLGDTISKTCAITLECHKKRTEKLLKAYGIYPDMFSVEELLLGNNSKNIPSELMNFLNQFIGSKTEKALKKEARLLLLLQIFDPKGYLQRIFTKIRGIRYFDVDIPSRIA